MTKTEYMLSKIAEEASEVAQMASKCLRFGLEDKWPDEDSATCY